jgi:hypothetical protein
MHTITPDLQPLLSGFAAEAGRVRILLLVSPT